MARKKKTLISGIPREEAEAAFAKYCECEAHLKKITALIELACTKIREKYADEVSTLGDARDKAFEVLESFARENPDLFTNKKSLEMSYGTLGFRTGMPKLKPLKGFKWPDILELVKTLIPDYIRTTEEVAKDKIIADRDEDVEMRTDGQQVKVSMKTAMEKCGIQVVQEETFFVEPKKEDE